MIYRLYYNYANAYPYVWSFDEGDISTEKTVKNFCIKNCKVVGGFDAGADSKITPKAFLIIKSKTAKIDENEVVWFEE